MSFSYSPDQIAAKLDQEGCAGCAEEFLLAVQADDMLAAALVLRQAMNHIEDDGYNDGQAEATITALQLWVDETGLTFMEQGVAG